MAGRVGEKRGSYKPEERMEVAVGFAAGDDGAGVAYARVGSSSRKRLLRVPFTVRPLPGLSGRETAYAALRAVAARVREAEGKIPVRFTLDDEQMVLDLCERRPLPQALVLLYVSLGCELNRFGDALVEGGKALTRDLTARARAEVALHVAA